MRTEPFPLVREENLAEECETKIKTQGGTLWKLAPDCI